MCIDGKKNTTQRLLKQWTRATQFQGWSLLHTKPKITTAWIGTLQNN